MQAISWLFTRLVHMQAAAWWEIAASACTCCSVPRAAHLRLLVLACMRWLAGCGHWWYARVLWAAAGTLPIRAKLFRGHTAHLAPSARVAVCSRQTTASVSLVQLHIAHFIVATSFIVCCFHARVADSLRESCCIWAVGWEVGRASLQMCVAWSTVLGVVGRSHLART